MFFRFKKVDTWIAKYNIGEGYHLLINHKRANIDILRFDGGHDLNGDDDDPEYPFFAFDMASLTPGVSDTIGPVYENVSIDITEVLLDREAFDYTGQPIELTVFASEDVVPEDGYMVTYINNIESGDSAVVRV